MTSPPDRDTVARWEGYKDRECGEHRTLGERAWCFACSTYCHPDEPCPGCELPQLRAALAACKRELEEAERVTDSLDESFERHVEAYEALEAALKAEQEKSERLRGAITDSLDPRNYPRILAALNTSSEPPDQSP